MKVGDVCEACFTEDDVWYQARIDAISTDGKTFTVTYLEYGNSEDVTAERLRGDPEVSYKVGDICEGQFTEDDVWYQARIEAVSADGKTFTVTYLEYGNSEDITAERLRPASQEATTEQKSSPVATQSPYKVGDVCEGQFTEDDVWYQARIDAVSADGKTFTVTYLEYGNSEDITAERLRPASKEATPAPEQNLPVATQSPYKVGDVCEGQFTEDDVWYQARIDAVSADGKTFTVTYLEYGNSEDIPLERLRAPSQEAAAPYKAGDVCEGQFTEDDVWYQARIDAVSADGKTFTVTYLEYGNSEDITAERLRPASQAVAAPYKVGDVCEGQFTDDDVWYQARIDAVSADGKTFTVTYLEYGNSEDIPLERLRSSQSQGATTTTETAVNGTTEVDPWTSGADSTTTSSYSASNDENATLSLFVGGLSYDTDEDTLRGVFSEFGEIDKVRIVKDRETGKSKGFGYVDFYDLEHSKKAKEEANGREVNGRAMKIDFSQPRTGGGGGGGSRPPRSGGFGGSSGGSDKPPSASLFVGGLSFDTDEDALRGVFSEFGEIDRVRIVKDRDTGSSKGFGYVDFYDIENAKAAMENANGREVDGRSIRIDYSQPKGGAPGGGAGGRRGPPPSSSSSYSTSTTSPTPQYNSTPTPQQTNNQRQPPTIDILEPFDPTILNRTRKVQVESGTIIVTRNFETKKGLFGNRNN